MPRLPSWEAQDLRRLGARRARPRGRLPVPRRRAQERDMSAREYGSFTPDPDDSLPGFGEPGTPWSGTETSRARAAARDKEGTEIRLRDQVIEYLSLRSASGVTWREVASRFGVHHGSASSVLSTLHKAGHIHRLSERRDKRAVYVLPQFTEGRPVMSYGGRPKIHTCPACGHTYSEGAS